MMLKLSYYDLLAISLKASINMTLFYSSSFLIVNQSPI